MDIYSPSMTSNNAVSRREVVKALGVTLGVSTGTVTLSSATASASDLTIRQSNGDAALRGEREHCNISASVVGDVGDRVGTQVRVRCADDGAKYDSGLYTIVGDCRKKDTVEMGKEGLSRVGFENKSQAEVRTYAPHPDYETRAEASEHDEYVEILEDDGEQSTLVACAPHGGWIEYPTDKQSARVAETLGVTEWTCAGYNSGGGAYDRWHITSTEIDRRSFPGLDTIADRGFDHAVSFHGFSEEGIAIGGGAPEALKVELQETISEAVGSAYDVYVVDSDNAYSGDSEENFVNWLTEDNNGIQIEQSWDVRTDHWDTVADAVSRFYATRSDQIS